jgi:hypothetical protein
MFVVKARSLPLSLAPKRCFSCLTCKYYIILERLAGDERSSLFRKFVNYGRKKFYKTGTRMTIPVESEVSVIDPLGRIRLMAETEVDLGPKL